MIDVEGVAAVEAGDARTTIERWREHYDHERSHSALGYRTPQEFADEVAAREGCGKDAGCARLENAPRFPLSYNHDGGGCLRDAVPRRP